MAYAEVRTIAGWAAARRSGKPLNVIALNGTLDDESC